MRFIGDTSVLEDASLVWSEVLVLVGLCLTEALAEELCGDIMMGSASPSIGLIVPVCTEPPNLMPISSLLLPTTPSYVHAVHEPLDDVRGYYPSLDPYCAYL